MRPMLRRLFSAGLLILSVLVAMHAGAGIRASFGLDYCTWRATDIVFVRTTATDGVFSVVKPLKGNLKSGDLLEISDLKPDSDAVSIAKHPMGEASWSDDPKGISEQSPREPPGSQMILFLKRGAMADFSPQSSGKTVDGNWKPAGIGGMRTSAVWLQDRTAYCFQQWENPGPSALVDCRVGRWSSDVAVIESRIREVVELQNNLSRTLASKNTAGRAEELGRIAMSDVYDAQVEAMDGLGKSGSIALPEVFEIMDKPATFYDGEKLIKLLVTASGKDSGPQLHARLQQDVIFWKAVGPTLNPDWSGELITVGDPLFMKFNETKLIVQELTRERYAPANRTVVELRNFWVSQPQLYDAKWGDHDFSRGGSVLQMIRGELYELVKDCDEFTKQVRVENNAR